MEPLPTPITALVDAVNDGDTERFVGCFGPGAVVVDDGRSVEDLEAIRTWSDALVGRKRVAVIDLLDTDPYVVRTELTDGTTAETANFAFVLFGDDIETMTITPA